MGSVKDAVFLVPVKFGHEKYLIGKMGLKCCLGFAKNKDMNFVCAHLIKIELHKM
jgi:hypothetical protein